MSAIGHHPVSLLDDPGGSRRPFSEPRRTRPPRAPAGRSRFRGAEQGTRSALPRFEATGEPSPASGPGWKPTEPRRRAPERLILTVALRRERGAGIGSAKTRAPGLGEPRVRREMRPNNSANNPLFKDREPELHAVFRPGLSRGTGERRASWRGARFQSSGFARCVGLFDQRAAQNRLSSNAPSGSLPAGPHERCRPSTIQSAFGRRAAPTNRNRAPTFCQPS